MKVSKIIPLGLAVIAVLANGCYSSTSLSRTPPKSAQIVPPRATTRLPAAYLTSIQTSVNGAVENMNATFESRVVGRLQEAKLFDDVVSVLGHEKRIDGPHYELVLHTDETEYPHTFSNMCKVYGIAFTCFLLTPALPLGYETEASMTLTVRTSDSREKSYTATARGVASGTFGSDIIRAQTKVKSQVIESCLVSLVNQLIDDDWLRANQKT